MSDYYRVERVDGWTVYLYQPDSRTVTLLSPTGVGTAWLNSDGMWIAARTSVPPAIRALAQRMWDEQAAALAPTTIPA